MKHDRIAPDPGLAPVRDARAVTFHPAPDAPRWLPFILLAGLAFYPALAWLIFG